MSGLCEPATTGHDGAISVALDEAIFALKAVAVEHGIAGGTPGSAPPYLAIGQLQFDSLEAFQASFGPHSQEIMADIPNYTDTQPIIQISAVKL
ncbi:MAG TPA: EthD family reductase [Candidatus Acidoferrum sp.]